jgi:hypothetical protein
MCQPVTVRDCTPCEELSVRDSGDLRVPPGSRLVKLAGGGDGSLYAVGDGRDLLPYRRPRAATCSVLPGLRLMAGRAHQQPSYGAHGAVPSWAYAVANTWFCSAADAFPKSAGLPPAATQAE